MLARAFREGSFCLLGTSLSIRFWLDSWAGLDPLHIQFPRFFALASNKNCRVSDSGTFVNGGWTWNVPFRRQLLGWEQDLYQKLEEVITKVIPSQGEDALIWTGDSTGHFSVKSILTAVEARIFEAPTWSIPSIIRKVAPPKVTQFLWQVLNNRIATKENLLTRGINIEDGGLCCFCGLEIESTSHLMLHCVVPMQLLNAVMQREGLIWCCPNGVLDLMLEWDQLRKGTDRLLWDLIPFSLFWSIWLSRNQVSFKNQSFSFDSIWDIHLSRICAWVQSWWKECPYSSYDFAQFFGEIKTHQSSPRIRSSEWSPPPPDLVKFNVDGFSLGNPGSSGVGGVLRNHNKDFLGIFSEAIPDSWAYEAEVLAILKALLFCKLHSFRNVLIESDSTLAVGWVNNSSNRPWKLVNALNQIDTLMVEVECSGVGHIYREANSIADELAKSGHSRVIPLCVLF